MAIDWPQLDEVKQRLNVESLEWDGDVDGPTRLERVRLAAIAKVKLDVGDWDEYSDVPDEALSQAALRMAELIALRPEAAAGVVNDPTYRQLLFGHRRKFGIA
jgi:hypothetical protein